MRTDWIEAAAKEINERQHPLSQRPGDPLTLKATVIADIIRRHAPPQPEWRDAEALAKACKLARDELAHATWAKGADQRGLKYAIEKCDAALESWKKSAKVSGADGSVTSPPAPSTTAFG